MIKNGFGTILLFSLSFSDAIARRILSLPFAGYDEDARVQVGFQYNYTNQKYQIVLNNNWLDIALKIPMEDNAFFSSSVESAVFNQDVRVVYSFPSQGFSFGIPIDVKWRERMALNFTPSFTIFNAHRIIYSSSDQNTPGIIRKSKHTFQDDKGDNFNSFEFPIALKLLSDNKKLTSLDTHYWGYILGGVRLTRWAGIQRHYDQLELNVAAGQSVPESIILRPEYISLEGGVGFDIITSYFKVSPEVRFSQSVHNVLNNNSLLVLNNTYMAPITMRIYETFILA